jgi:hypothetical protein
MGEMINAYKNLVGKPEGRDPSEDLCTDGSIILKWIIWNSDWRVWIGFMWLG